MENKDILEANELIAHFYGGKQYPKGKWYKCYPGQPNDGYVSVLKYNNDWSWLIPVVEKIAQNYDVRITWMPTGINVTYVDRPNVSEGEITSMGGMTAIENTFIAVSRFIKWYNTKSPNRKAIQKQ